MLFTLPTLAIIIKSPPNTEKFTELYMLGPNHNFDNIPFDIKTGQTYSVFLGVKNHMGASAYYTCHVKIANQNELPTTTPPKQSVSDTLYEFKSFLSYNESWETPLTFKIDNLKQSNNALHISDITLNGIHYTIDKTITIDKDNKSYFAYLVVELWIFNSTTNSMQYDNRFVLLNLNLNQ